MNYAQINTFDVANGEGIRVSLFVQGCHLHCDGCFNRETWNFDGGKPFTAAVQQQIFDSINPHIAGLSILGGEPLAYENYIPVLRLTEKFKSQFPDKTIWLWTGFNWDVVHMLNIMSYIDVCVAGPYIKAQRDLSLAYCGSSNQEVIDVQASLKSGHKCLYHKETV